jgi:hypothetical protein
MINKLSSLYGREVLCCEMCDKWTPDWIGVENMEGVLCEDCCNEHCEVQETREERFYYLID